MYETDDLYNAAATKLGVTPEVLDEALGGVTLVAGDSYLIEVMATGEFAVMVPRSAAGDDDVPENFVAILSAMIRIQKEPAFLEELLAWADREDD